MENRLLEVVFPRFCLGCGYVGVYLCPHCEQLIKRPHTQICIYCEKPSHLGLTHPRCRRKEGIDGYMSLYCYNGLFKKIIQEVKYKGGLEILHELLRFPHEALFLSLLQWKSFYNPTVVEVPLHKSRLSERGFNQSEVIVNEYFIRGHWIAQKLLTREINTTHLARLHDKKARRLAIKNSFSYRGWAPPNTALLVDDIFTSGSTIRECTRVLKKNGVQTVLAFSLAR